MVCSTGDNHSCFAGFLGTAAQDFPPDRPANQQARRRCSTPGMASHPWHKRPTGCWPQWSHNRAVIDHRRKEVGRDNQGSRIIQSPDRRAVGSPMPTSRSVITGLEDILNRAQNPRQRFALGSMLNPRALDRLVRRIWRPEGKIIHTISMKEMAAILSTKCIMRDS
jgi:hypothetical protein